MASPLSPRMLLGGIPDLGPAPAAERWRPAERAGRLGKAAVAVLVASLTVHAGLVLMAWLMPTPKIEPEREIPVEIVAEAPKPSETKPAETKPAAPEPPAAEAAKTEAPKAEPPKAEPAKPEPPKVEHAEAEPPKVEPPKAEPTKAEPPNTQPTKTESSNTESARPDPAQAQREALSQELDALKAEQAALDAEQASETAKNAAAERAATENAAAKSEPAAAADPAGPLRDSIRAIALPSAGEDGEIVGYQSVVFSELAKAKERFPPMARAGKVGVRFAVGPDGSLTGADVAVSSGDAKLDEMALAIVRAAAPFPVPPPGAQRSFSANFAYAGSR